jgi:hypothetical protein
MLDFRSVSKVLPSPGFTGRDVKEAALSSLGIHPALLKALLKPPASSAPLPQSTDRERQSGPSPMFGRTETDRILQSIGKLEGSTNAQTRKVISTLKRGFGLDEFDKARGTGGTDKERGLLGGLVDRLTKGGTRIGAGASRLSKMPGVSKILKVGAGVLSAGLAGWSKYTDIADRTDLTTGQKATQVGSTAAGAGLGAWGGAAAGAALGSVVPVVGTFIGGLIGAAVGGWLGGKGGEMVGEKISDNFSNIRDGATRLWDRASTALTVTLPSVLEKRAASIIGDKGVEKIGFAARAVADAGVKAVIAPAEAARMVMESAVKVAAGAKRVMADIKQSVENRWQHAKGLLMNAATAAGVDPRILARITNFESKFDPNARPMRRDGSLISSAHGYGQFLDGTWIKMVQQHGEKYGLAGASKFTPAQALSHRGNEQLQANLLAEFTKRNIELGRRYGGENDDANVYALHNLGEGDGAKFLRALKSAPGSPVSQVLSSAVIGGNKSLYGDGTVTVREAYSRMVKKMAEGEAYARDITSNLAAVKEARDPKSTQAAPAQAIQAGGQSGSLVGQLQLKDVPLSPMDPMLAGVNTGAFSK